MNFRKGKKIFRWIIYFLSFVFTCSIVGSIVRSVKDRASRSPKNYSDKEWATDSYGYAPHPDDYKDAVIQVYGARTRGTKKALAVHTWIAFKRSDADEYEIAQIFGWRLRRNGTALNYGTGVPDRAWAGNAPDLILDIRGKEADRLINRVESAIHAYPWKDEYTVWPGPNSNTFIAWIGLQVPELQLDLPSTAIGKDWRPITESFGSSVSGTGIQASLYGLLGITVAYEEGLEINILGISTELDIFDLTLELPGIGRVW